MMPLVILFLCASCAPKHFPSVSPARNEWKIFLQFDPIVPEVVQENIQAEFNYFAMSTISRPVRFVEVDDPQDADMVMIVRMFKPVTPGQSAAGVVVSLVGLSLPMIMAAAEAPFYVFFYYFPKSRSFIEIRAENHAGPSTLTHQVLGPGFLLSEEKQQAKHVKGYRGYFAVMQRQYEKELKKELRKR